MGVVTKEEYEKAKKNIEFCRNSMRMSQNKIMELVNDLATEKNNYDSYQEIMDNNKAIMIRYEVQHTC